MSKLGDKSLTRGNTGHFVMRASRFFSLKREKGESGFMSFSVLTALYNATYFRKSPSPDNHTDMGKTERGKHNSLASSLQKNIVKLYTVIKRQRSLFIYY